MSKRKLKEVPIFPVSCEKGHDFKPITDDRGNARGYYKNNNNSVVYAMLFCSRCGETKEISIVNRI